MWCYSIVVVTVFVLNVSHYFHYPGQSFTLTPTIRASKQEVIEDWEGFDVICEVNIPLETSVNIAWDYPGQLVRKLGFVTKAPC